MWVDVGVSVDGCGIHGWVSRRMLPPLKDPQVKRSISCSVKAAGGDVLKGRRMAGLRQCVGGQEEGPP